MRKAVIYLIRAYQLIVSPFLGQHCRYFPTCSHYAMQAIERFGIFHGSWIAVRRVLRCHPWHEGGVDPVPEKAGKP